MKNISLNQKATFELLQRIVKKEIESSYKVINTQDLLLYNSTFKKSVLTQLNKYFESISISFQIYKEQINISITTDYINKDYKINIKESLDLFLHKNCYKNESVLRYVEHNFDYIKNRINEIELDLKFNQSEQDKEVLKAKIKLAKENLKAYKTLYNFIISNDFINYIIN